MQEVKVHLVQTEANAVDALIEALGCIAAQRPLALLGASVMTGATAGAMTGATAGTAGTQGSVPAPAASWSSIAVLRVRRVYIVRGSLLQVSAETATAPRVTGLVSLDASCPACLRTLVDMMQANSTDWASVSLPFNAAPVLEITEVDERPKQALSNFGGMVKTVAGATIAYLDGKPYVSHDGASWTPVSQAPDGVQQDPCLRPNGNWITLPVDRSSSV